MSLAWNTLCHIPRLRDYAAASKRESETTPVRGDEYKRKPLGKRNQKYRHIKRLDDDSIGIFEYSVEVPHIRYFPTGDIHIVDISSWNKATCNEIITEVLGLPVHTEQRQMWVRYDGGTAPLRRGPQMQYVSGEGWVRPNTPHTPSVFRMNERGNLVYINPPAIPTHVVSRKGAKAVRTRYMAALGYIEALAKLRKDDMPLNDELIQAFPEKFSEESVVLQVKQYPWTIRSKLPPLGYRAFKRSDVIEIVDLMRSEEPGAHYRAYLWLQLDAAPDKVLANADTVLAWVHRDEWFVEREAIVGKKVHDRYAWAFKD